MSALLHLLPEIDFRLGRLRLCCGLANLDGKVPIFFSHGLRNRVLQGTGFPFGVFQRGPLPRCSLWSRFTLENFQHEREAQNCDIFVFTLHHCLSESTYLGRYFTEQLTQPGLAAS